MDNTKKAEAAAADLRTNEKKWSKELMAAGWTVLPNILIERQLVLGLDAVDINILLHLASYWWKPGDKPYPSKRTIAAAMGVDSRTIQRRIARMEADNYIRREQRRLPGIGSKTNVYHLDGLIAAAKPYALEKVEEMQAKASERANRAARKGKPKLRVVKGDEE